MPGLFDTTLKDLVFAYPGDWLAHLGLPAHLPVEVRETDLSTVVAIADRALCVQEPIPWLIHIEFVSSWESDPAGRFLKYNVLLEDHTGLSVLTVVMLLRREAEHPRLTGLLERHPPMGGGGLTWHYRVVRLWQQPVDAVLNGGIGTLPLAPLCDVASEVLPSVIRRMEERLDTETPPAEAATLWTSTYLLMGLRYPPELAGRLLQGVRAMKESSTYQAILSEGETIGRAEQTRKVLLLLGSQKFGVPDADTRAAVEAADIGRLEAWMERLLQVPGWQELLASA